MDSKQLHGQCRRAVFKWEASHRLALHLMHTEFQLSQETIEAVFYHMYCDYIRSCGLSKLHPGCLRGQYKERAKDSKSHLWAVTFSPLKTAQEMATRSEIRDRIADAVRAVDTNGGAADVSVEIEHISTKDYANVHTVRARLVSQGRIRL